MFDGKGIKKKVGNDETEERKRRQNGQKAKQR